MSCGAEKKRRKWNIMAQITKMEIARLSPPLLLILSFL